MQDKNISNLLHDERFLNYCFRRNADDISYWEQWLDENPADRDEINKLKTLAILLAQEVKDQETNAQVLQFKQKINERKDLAGSNIFRLRPFLLRITAAASLLLICSVGVYLYLHKKTVANNSQMVSKNIAPGGNKAILTLANGRQIILTDAKNGKIAQQGSIAINKTANGMIVYNFSESLLSDQGLNDGIAYNTMSTPRGGQYHLTLSDGTNVWLNDTSSIKYPASFKGNSREVEITGEVYFEVAKNKLMPFRVKTAQQVVEVLGTHFNIDSYADEDNTKTTLLEGSVKVSATANNKTVTLHPGQQSQVNDNNIVVKDDLNTADIAAWKDGFFVFDSENIQSIMRKVSRWYSVKVIYEGNFNDVELSGSVSRFKNIAELLKTLQLTQLVHFKVKDNTVTVSAN